MKPRSALSLAPKNDLRILEDRFSVFRAEASIKTGAHWVIGLDEVGRGCLAGPVTAAAFAYRITSERMLWKPSYRVMDSKKLSSPQRVQAQGYILNNPEFLSCVSESSVEEIDEINILHASLLAMKRSYESVRRLIPESANVWTLVDGHILPKITACESAAIIKGDNKSFAIAVAAILAKEHRDERMKKLSESFPHYKWEKNVGYPTPAHASALKKIGVSSWHRKSFRMGGVPLHEFCEGLECDAELSSETGNKL
ncbi:MAG: ribonuclease HII [Bdellovibrionota bacterium]